MPFDLEAMKLDLAEMVSADEELSEARKLTEQKMAKRSDTIKKLYERYGKGPYQYQGKSCIIVIKGCGTHFFRGSNSKEPIKVD